MRGWLAVSMSWRNSVGLEGKDFDWDVPHTSEAASWQGWAGVGVGNAIVLEQRLTSTFRYCVGRQARQVGKNYYDTKYHKFHTRHAFGHWMALQIDTTNYLGRETPYAKPPHRWPDHRKIESQTFAFN